MTSKDKQSTDGQERVPQDGSDAHQPAATPAGEADPSESGVADDDPLSAHPS